MAWQIAQSLMDVYHISKFYLEGRNSTFTIYLVLKRLKRRIVQSRGEHSHICLSRICGLYKRVRLREAARDIADYSSSKIFLRFWLAPIPRISLHIKPGSHMSGKSQTIIASHAGVFRGARFSSLPTAPLKTPVWEAKTIRDLTFCRPSQILPIYRIIARPWFLKSRFIYPPISSQSMIKFLISRITNRGLKSCCWKRNYPAIS